MKFRDASDFVTKEYQDMGYKRPYNAITYDIDRPDGLGLSAGNFYIDHAPTQILIGFSYGDNKEQSRQFFKFVIGKLQTRWPVVAVPQDRGAWPLKSCPRDPAPKS
jgi:hypothetical protein